VEPLSEPNDQKKARCRIPDDEFYWNAASIGLRGVTTGAKDDDTFTKVYIDDLCPAQPTRCWQQYDAIDGCELEFLRWDSSKVKVEERRRELESYLTEELLMTSQLCAGYVHTRIEHIRQLFPFHILASVAKNERLTTAVGARLSLARCDAVQSSIPQLYSFLFDKVRGASTALIRSLYLTKYHTRACDGLLPCVDHVLLQNSGGPLERIRTRAASPMDQQGSLRFGSGQ
jgi:hypothetical protein